MDFAKECLKTYDALIHYIRKFVTLQFKALNSENGPKTGRNIPAIMPVTF